MDDKTITKSNKIKKKNSLLENNQMAKWINNVLMNKMDKFAFARSLVLFSTQAFFLGNNHGIYLWLHIIITIYLLIYRMIRFWVKRWLMYITEFCYFGNILLLSFLLFLGQNEKVFKTVYVANSGVMAIAVILFNNQAHFSSTDHLTSSFIHTIPLITCWTIRWGDKIYFKDNIDSYRFNILKFDEIKFEFNNSLYELIYLPMIFWSAWAVFYLILTTTILNKYTVDQKYGSGVGDFVHSSPKIIQYVFGDMSRYSCLKYILQHLFFFVVCIPLAIISYYNYIFNCVYIGFIILFLGWNTGRNNLKDIERKLKQNNNLETTESEMNLEMKVEKNIGLESL